MRRRLEWVAAKVGISRGEGWNDYCGEGWNGEGWNSATKDCDLRPLASVAF